MCEFRKRLRADNIFATPPAILGREHFLTLLENQSVRIERIVSHAHTSPPGFWYDQAEDEWVIVLRGYAVLEFDGGEFLEMKEGDFIVIPKHLKHRVNRTAAETVWLAVFVG